MLSTGPTCTGRVGNPRARAYCSSARHGFESMEFCDSAKMTRRNRGSVRRLRATMPRRQRGVGPWFFGHAWGYRVNENELHAPIRLLIGHDGPYWTMILGSCDVSVGHGSGTVLRIPLSWRLSGPRRLQAHTSRVKGASRSPSATP
jgi:hypothetical protein